MDGWIKIHRKITEWEWYKNPNMVLLYLHLLVSANHKDNTWQGIEVKRGQLVVGRKQLSQNTGISEQSLRTCIKRLKSTNEITIKSTNKYTIITILKYEDYQSIDDKPTIKSTNKLTNNQPTTNQQLTTNKNDKNDKNIYIPKNKNQMLLHDGTPAYKKFGRWYSSLAPDSVLDPKFYPEITKE